MDLRFPSSRRGEAPALPTLVSPTQNWQETVPAHSSAREASPRNTIHLRGPLNLYTSYGELTFALAHELMGLGYAVTLSPSHGNVIDERWGARLTPILKECIIYNARTPWELVIGDIMTPKRCDRTVFYTMHEAESLNQRQTQYLREADFVCAPTPWNAKAFKAATKKDVPVVPLGIDTGFFKPSSMHMDGPCVFLTAGRFAGAGSRKAVDFAIESFLAAFTKGEDVKLVIKTHEDSTLPDIADDRISIINAHLPPVEFRELIQRSTALFLPSRGEAWGLIAQQASALGRPCVLALYGGFRAYLTASSCYPVKFDLKESPDSYYQGSKQASLNRDSAVKALRSIYKDRKAARSVGRRAAVHASKFTIRQTTFGLLDLLREWDFID